MASSGRLWPLDLLCTRRRDGCVVSIHFLTCWQAISNRPLFLIKLLFDFNKIRGERRQAFYEFSQSSAALTKILSDGLRPRNKLSAPSNDPKGISVSTVHLVGITIFYRYFSKRLRSVVYMPEKTWDLPIIKVQNMLEVLPNMGMLVSFLFAYLWSFACRWKRKVCVTDDQPAVKHLLKKRAKRETG